MTWLTPAIALLAAAIAIPALVILYFLKLRRIDVDVSSTLLWKKAIQDLQANAPFQKLRRNILLLLQMLALLAALVAIAQPQLAGESAVGTKHVIMIDRSASMAAEDEQDDASPASRLERAKKLAIEVVDNLREPGLLDRTRGVGGDQAMVIVFDSSARALQSFTSDKAALKRAIESIEPSDAPTSADEAFRLARAQAPRRVYRDDRSGEGALHERPSGPVGTIHLFTDGRLPDVSKAELSPEDIIVYHKVGQAETMNIGITSLRASRSIENPRLLSIFVGVQTTETSTRRVPVELQIDGRAIEIKSVDLPAATKEKVVPEKSGAAEDAKAEVVERVAPATGGAVFTLERPEGGVVTVEARTPESDVLPSDDRASVVAPASKALRVAVVTGGNLFIREALAGMTLAKLDVLTPDQFEASRAAPGPGYDVVVLDGYVPKLDAGAGLPAGRWLLFNAVPPGELGLVNAGETGATFMLDWQRDHPVLRDASLESLAIAKTRKIEIPKSAAARVIASTDSGPAILEWTSGEARAIVVGFDALDSNWPFQTSWVLFLVQSVAYLGDDSAGVGQTVQPGGVISDRLPAGASDLRMRLPGGASESMGDPATDGRVVFGPVQRAGVYQMTWRGPAGATDTKDGDRATRLFAANLLDPAESDIAAAPTIALSTQIARAQTDEATQRAALPLWPMLLAAMALLLVVEWYVYNRKVQV